MTFRGVFGWMIFLGMVLPAMVARAGQESFDLRLVARYLFEGDYSDETGFGFHGAEGGSFLAFSGDLHPLADLMAEDPERGGVYSYTWDEVMYDWGKGGNPRNSRINIESQRVLPSVPANIGVTLMAWVKRPAVHTMDNGGNVHFGPIFQLGNCGDHPVATMAICDDGTLAGYIEGGEVGLAGDQVFVECDGVVTPNEWVHCAIVFDRANDVGICYIDGIPQSTPMDLSSVSDGVMDFDRAYLASFCNRDMAFVGQLDDARIYYGALSAPEIEEVYNLNKAPGEMTLSADFDFLASPGAGVTLSWAVEGHCELVLEPGGLVLENGQTSVLVHPAETTTYTLVAKNGSGRRSQSQTVVVGEVPEIVSFGADRIAVLPGGGITLSWEVAGASDVEINHGVDLGDPRAIIEQTKTFTLTATNEVGTSSSQFLVEVIPFSNATYLIDFTDTRTPAGRPNLAAADGQFWNPVVNFRDGRLSPLVDTQNVDSQGMGISVVDGFSQLSSESAVGANAFTELAAVDGFLSDVFTSDGYAELLLDGLDGTGATSYTLTFFSSAAETEGGDLVVRYTLVGRDTQSVTLDSNGNIDQTAQVAGVIPSPDGKIVIQLQPDSPFGLGVGINAMKIESHLARLAPRITSVKFNPENGRPIVSWQAVPGRVYSVERSSDLVFWQELDDNLVSPGIEGVWENPELSGEREFYRIIDKESE